MWGDDANDRVIPTIPAPRASDDVPACCGQSMKQDADQWVCRKCQGDGQQRDGRRSVRDDAGRGGRPYEVGRAQRSETPLDADADIRTGTEAEQRDGDAAPVSRLRRAARALGRRTARDKHRWQCAECGKWFESDRPSQLCPDCK